MSPLLSLFALTQAFGFCLLLHVMRSAPEGYEDETGFHYTNAGVSPVRGLAPVSGR